MSNLSQKAKAARAHAIDAGESTYVGRSCHRCHTKVKTLFGNCVQCSSDIDDSYYKRNRDRIKESAKARYRADPVGQLLRNARTRATHSGMDFNIGREDVIIPELCPVLGVPMVSPSLDRFDNSKGYTKTNIRVISKRANVLKSDATIEELEKIIQYMKEDTC